MCLATLLLCLFGTDCNPNAIHPPQQGGFLLLRITLPVAGSPSFPFAVSPSAADVQVDAVRPVNPTRAQPASGNRHTKAAGRTRTDNQRVAGSGSLVAGLNPRLTEPVSAPRPDRVGPAGGNRQGAEPAAERPGGDVAKEPSRPAAPPSRLAVSTQIDALLRKLDSDRFAERQAAQAALLKFGERAVPQLARIPEGASRERRLRQELILKNIRRGVLLRSFRELAAQPEEKLDIEQGMWLISKIIDPVVNRKSLSAELDRLAAMVRQRLGPAVDPSRGDPAVVVEAMRATLFEDFGLKGAVANYDHPDNSSLKRVLERKRGLPILLSHVMVSVAERLDVPLVGLPMPGRYMVKYEGSRTPAGFPKRDVIIDPFGGGKILSQEELRMIIPSFDPDSDLEASGRRETVARMLRNLVSDFAAVGNEEAAEQVGIYLQIVEAGGPRVP